ncbi:hypothetical protein JCM30760_26510 [Thiomicrorhabdus hydrogeniphila]
MALNELSQQEIRNRINGQTAEELYSPNDLDLLPSEAEVLQRYLNARPEYLFVDMPEDYWVGDELAALKRHGFRLGTISPFKDLFYNCSELLLRDKKPSVPEFTSEEISLIKNASSFTVTKKMLIQICVRHGISRFKNNGSHSFVSMECAKMPMANGLVNKLIELGLATSDDLIFKQ